MSRNELIAALHALEPALRDLEDAITTGGGIGGAGGLGPVALGAPSKPGAAGDKDDQSLFDSILKTAKQHPVAAGLSILATAGVSAGAIAAARGGDFGAGAASGLTAAVGAIPVLGEILGAAPSARVEREVSGGIIQQIAEIERFGGRIPEGETDLLLREHFRIGGNRERSVQRLTLQAQGIANEGATGFPRFQFGTVGNMFTQAVLALRASGTESAGVEAFR